MADELKFEPSKISKSLMDIGLITGDGVNFLKLRSQFELWEKEAKEGNKDSQQLVDILTHFESLVKLITRA